MFVLLWVMLTTAGELKHYHISSHSSEQACEADLKRSKILVTTKNSKVICIKIER